METRGIKTCEYCHQPYIGGKRAHYCSSTCQTNAWRKRRERDTLALRERLRKEQDSDKQG
jgi:hypothetical protein